MRMIAAVIFQEARNGFNVLLLHVRVYKHHQPTPFPERSVRRTVPHVPQAFFTRTYRRRLTAASPSKPTTNINAARGSGTGAAEITVNDPVPVKLKECVLLP